MTAQGWGFGPAAFETVETNGLSRAYGRVHALYDVSLRLKAGEVSCVVGPNGAGKSTLLAQLATLDRPTEGSVVFGGSHDSVRGRETVRPHIGLVAHDSLLYGELTGIENLEFCAQLYGCPEDRASMWLERVGLTDADNKPVSSYSRGMRQRLSIARALLSEPTLVLFDEPLTGLDRSAREFLYQTVERLRAARRIVVVVTHHLAWPAGELDRLIVMEGGRVRYDGAPEPNIATVYAREVRS
jgi:heme exporter protein A